MPRARWDPTPRARCNAREVRCTASASAHGEGGSALSALGLLGAAGGPGSYEIRIPARRVLVQPLLLPN